MLIVIFSLFSLICVLGMDRYRTTYGSYIVALQPFITYYLYTKIHFHFIYSGGGVVFYPFGYVTLCIPLASLSVILYYLLGRWRENKE